MADLRRALHDPPTQLPQQNSNNHVESGVSQPIPLPSHSIVDATA